MIALFMPGLLFLVGLGLVRDLPRFAWLGDIAEFPWEIWVIALAGSMATAGGVLDWRYHRSGHTVIGEPEHRSEAAALVSGGVPLFVLMAVASVTSRPALWLVPILVVVIYTTVLICFDEFVYHRRRCGRYETTLHRLLVFGNGTAWLVWMHWCFVREAGHG
ncbi:MAG: hypothetical protein EXS05_03020 [Planctomycetaceae bacterium]|nr:hypothetical protein [Planctomycetaceae bacterium]